MASSDHGSPEVRAPRALASLWQRPIGDYPAELWPMSDLRFALDSPTAWLTISEHLFTDEKHGGTSCVLIKPESEPLALRETTWLGSDLGEVGIWNDGRFDSGLQSLDDGVAVEFMAHARKPSGAGLPIPEISHPFLWYWDAVPIKNGWKYLNRAGREEDLIRWERSEDGWKIELRALEFRQFLAAYERTAVMQLDYTTKLEGDEFDRVDDSFQSDWAHFSFFAVHDTSMHARPAFSGLMGRYLLRGLKNSRAPRFQEREQRREFVHFICAVDPTTGEELTHSCDPDTLDASTFLTPVYFKREVLQPYAAEPNRYRLSTTRLSCLDLWGVDISFNSIGLVEVYLGDIGRSLPPSEWGRWRSYNVAPEGGMDEGRFRRDFLNQSVSSRNPVGDLRRARDQAAALSAQLLGLPIWKPLSGDEAAQFDSLIGPLSDDSSALGAPLLLLTKVLVDAIDPKPLKKALGTVQPGELSLQLLRRYAIQLGDDSDLTHIFRELQNFRSKGGVAHLTGSHKAAAAASLGITDLPNLEAFESIVERTTVAIGTLSSLMS